MSFESHLRMSGDKACGKRVSQYTGKHPDEGSVVTSRDTTATETRCIRLAKRTESQCASKKKCEMCDIKQAGGKEETEKDNQCAGLMHWGSTPYELWESILLNRNWKGERTLMLRMTSKQIKEIVDKIRPVAVVCLNRILFEQERATCKFKATDRLSTLEV